MVHVYECTRCREVSKNVTPFSTAERISEIISFLSGYGGNEKFIPMHPSPNAETSKPFVPSFRFCIGVPL